MDYLNGKDTGDANLNNNRTRWSLAAFERILKTRLLRRPSHTLQSVAVKTWEIAPSETSTAPPAFYLPDQLERVTGWGDFYPNEHPRRTMEGRYTTGHNATKGFLLKDVWLIDGAFYKDDAYSWMSPRTGWWPQARVECEIDRGAVFCTAGGYRYFGSWIMDDCVAYPLACDEGIPITTTKTAYQTATTQSGIFHAPGYTDWFGMNPTHVHTAFFRELVIFEDLSQNRHRHLRFRNMSDRLISHVQFSPHPGVFILRGRSGDLRLLHNELELAEYLHDRRGFRILDPAKSDVPSIVATCAGAQTIVGVEGSHLIHGIVALQPGGSLLTLQPPDRFLSGYKYHTDREHQNFGFVVGHAQSKGFHIDPEEVERTLDLFPA